MSAHIVYAEDDVGLAALIKEFLERNDFTVTIVADGRQVQSTVEQESPDLVLLDIMLPNNDGLSICQSLRATYHKPIILFTANDSDIKHILGLDLGANDYVVKTTPPNVLLARIGAQLRQFQSVKMLAPTEHNVSQVNIGQLHIDKPSRNVRIGDEVIHLSSSDFDMLWLLASHAGEILTRDQLLRATRGIDYDGLDRSIDIAISRLRKKLLDDSDEPTRIKTIRNKGYLLTLSGWE